MATPGLIMLVLGIVDLASRETTLSQASALGRRLWANTDVREGDGAGVHLNSDEPGIRIFAAPLPRNCPLGSAGSAVNAVDG
ncbi:hypothetical protein [Microvirga sp. VF16]|uniref:hypothetical protein n=1 Tax=Microvirga sp. VF16 TaxID=2807101 RepID=UPI001FEEAE46|nr:hypothetical protein [Microvirga sp. VF16]